MCARCERSTEEPVLIQRIKVPAGPDLNVYACPECATHYTPHGNAVEALETAHRRSRLTLRIYKIDTAGKVTGDRGEIEIIAGGPHEPVPYTSTYPPCTCPRCRQPR
jgi:hypothetical protein